MKEKFIITIESFHYADRGTQNNVSGKNEVYRFKAMMGIILCKRILIVFV